jgi:antitoxin MazE
MIKVGNSLGVTIPAEIIEKIHLNQGDSVRVELDENGNIVLTPVRKIDLPQNVRPEVLDAAYHVMRKYKDTLKRLQDR